MENKKSIDELVYRSCLALDDNDYVGYLNLCDPEFHYSITAFSPEIRKNMTWLEHDWRGLKTLFDNLPKHNSDQSPLSRHATVYTMDIDESRKTAKAITFLEVFKTTLDGGVTELFAVGKMHDTIALSDGNVRLLSRNVRLTTRMLGFGYHVPF